MLPRAGETVEEYVVKEVHGIPFEAKLRHALSESTFETNTGPLSSKGTLVVRVYRTNAPLGFPPDMVPRGLVVAPKFDVKHACEHAVVDADHYVEGRMPLDMDQTSTQLLSLHKTMKAVFEATTTKHARDAWA